MISFVFDRYKSGHLKVLLGFKTEISLLDFLEKQLYFFLGAQSDLFTKVHFHPIQGLPIDTCVQQTALFVRVNVLPLDSLLCDFFGLSVLSYDDLSAFLCGILTIELRPLFHILLFLTLRELGAFLPHERIHGRGPALLLFHPLGRHEDAEHFGLVATQKILVVQIADSRKAGGEF